MADPLTRIAADYRSSTPDFPHLMRCSCLTKATISSQSWIFSPDGYCLAKLPRRLVFSILGALLLFAITVTPVTSHL